MVSLEVFRGTGTGGPVSGHAHLSSDDVRKVWPHALWEMMDNSGDFPPRTHHLSRW